MTKSSKTVLFFGNERLATGVSTSAPTLQRLIVAGYDVKAVISNFERGTSRNARELEIKKVAEANGIPVLLPNKLSEVSDDIRKFGATIGVLVAYGKMVPQSIIDLFPRGIVNIHPSLLPKHRGSTPIESVILDGSQETGVSIMKLVQAMDAGPVYAQSPVTLSGNESKQELADHLLDIGGAMLMDILPGIIDGSVVAAPQANDSATYDSLINKNDGMLDWNKSALAIEREIRAYTLWPQSRAKIGTIDVIITKARVIHESGTPGSISNTGKDLVIHCGTDSLCIERLKPVGKSEMDSLSFLAGYRSQL